jgi:hypothetical protein
MSSNRKNVEVITGEKITGDVDLNQAVKGTSSPSAALNEVEGRSASGAFFFECAWCGAINYAEDTRGAGFFICFACGRAMRALC